MLKIKKGEIYTNHKGESAKIIHIEEGRVVVDVQCKNYDKCQNYLRINEFEDGVYCEECS